MNKCFLNHNILSDKYRIKVVRNDDKVQKLFEVHSRVLQSTLKYSVKINFSIGHIQCNL